jgi:hypothetical protein
MSTLLPVAEWGDEHQPFQIATRPPILHVAGRRYAHDRLWEYADGHLGFYGWLRVVNRRIERKLFLDTGLGLMDMPDRLWRDDYDDRVPPGESADLAIDEAAAELGMELP